MLEFERFADALFLPVIYSQEKTRLKKEGSFTAQPCHGFENDEANKCFVEGNAQIHSVVLSGNSLVVMRRLS